MLQLLLRAGAEMNPHSLIEAVQRGHHAVAEVLLGAGADVNSRTADGRTVLQLAATHCGLHRAHSAHEAHAGQPCCHLDTARALLRWGALVNETCPGGLTALMFAVRAGCLALVEVLLRVGATRHSRAVDGRTALDLAVQAGHTEVARALMWDAGRGAACRK